MKIERNCQGILQSNKMPGSITNRSTVGEYNNKKECMWLSQSKVVKDFRGSATIKRTANEYHNQMDFQNDCQGVPQSI